MPYINANGEWCSGRGGTSAAWGDTSGAGTIVATPAGETHWLDDDHVVYQHCVGETCRVKKYNVRTDTETELAPRGANNISAKGDVWAAWLGSYGVFCSTGLELPSAWVSPTSVGPDGEIAVKVEYQSAGPWDVHEQDGFTWRLTDGDAAFINMLGSRRACWVDETGEPRVTDGVPLPNPSTRPFWWLRMLETPDDWWCLYQEAENGNLVLHPTSSSLGYIVASGQNTYQPDLVLLDPTTIRVTWAVQVGEAPVDMRVLDIDLEAARVAVGGTPVSSPSNTISNTSRLPNGYTLSSSGSFGLAGLAEELVVAPSMKVPSVPVATGVGSIVHPTLGTYNYEVKPDEWLNVDANAIIPPVWSSARTLTSAANVLWPGHIRDVVVEERWKALGGLAMPVEQLRELLAIWMTPVDPEDGYVTWTPNYHTGVVFKVLPISLTVGGQGITLNDVVHYQDVNGPDGWVTDPVVLTMRLVEQL